MCALQVWLLEVNAAPNLLARTGRDGAMKRGLIRWTLAALGFAAAAEAERAATPPTPVRSHWDVSGSFEGSAGCSMSFQLCLVS